MNTLPIWLEFVIYLTMIGLVAAIAKYAYDLVKVIRK